MDSKVKEVLKAIYELEGLLCVVRNRDVSERGLIDELIREKARSISALVDEMYDAKPQIPDATEDFRDEIGVIVQESLYDEPIMPSKKNTDAIEEFYVEDAKSDESPNVAADVEEETLQDEIIEPENQPQVEETPEEAAEEDPEEVADAVEPVEVSFMSDDVEFADEAIEYDDIDLATDDSLPEDNVPEDTHDEGIDAYPDDDDVPAQENPVADEEIYDDAEEESEDDDSYYADDADDAEEELDEADDEADDEAADLRVDDLLSRSLSKNLKKAFTLNDRFRFRRELFSNSDVEFNDALNLVEAMATYDEAEDYFYNDLQWDAESPEVTDFMKIVKNHFA